MKKLQVNVDICHHRYRFPHNVGRYEQSHTARCPLVTHKYSSFLVKILASTDQGPEWTRDGTPRSATPHAGRPAVKEFYTQATHPCYCNDYSKVKGGFVLQSLKTRKNHTLRDASRAQANQRRVATVAPKRQGEGLTEQAPKRARVDQSIPRISSSPGASATTLSLDIPLGPNATDSDDETDSYNSWDYQPDVSLIRDDSPPVNSAPETTLPDAESSDDPEGSRPSIQTLPSRAETRVPAFSEPSAVRVAYITVVGANFFKSVPESTADWLLKQNVTQLTEDRSKKLETDCPAALQDHPKEDMAYRFGSRVLDLHRSLQCYRGIFDLLVRHVIVLSRRSHGNFLSNRPLLLRNI